MNSLRTLTLATLILGSLLLPAVIVPARSTGTTNLLLFDDFTHGSPSSQSVGQTTWDRMSLWTVNNVQGTTVWFPSSTVARFSNAQFSWPPAVSLISKNQWTIDSKLVLVERLRAWSFSDQNGGFAWQTALDWGAGSAVMGYGRDDAHNPNTGVVVGGECTESQPGSVLTTKNLLGQWLIAVIVLDGPKQTMSFFVFDSTGHILGQTSSTGYCGTMFGTLPARVLYFTSFGVADIDWIALFHF